MNSSLRCILIVVWSAATLLGCDSPTTTREASPSEAQQAATRPSPAALPALKAASATVPVAPARVVSLAPNLTEILFALGVGDRVVGVTKFCDHPEAVEALPKVGGFNQPDMETLVGLRPDLILGMASGPSQALPTKLEALKLNYLP